MVTARSVAEPFAIGGNVKERYTDHPMEVWVSTYGQPGGRGILMSFVQGPKARELGRSSRAEQLRFGLKAIEDVYPGIRSREGQHPFRLRLQRHDTTSGLARHGLGGGGSWALSYKYGLPVVLHTDDRPALRRSELE